MIEFCLAYIRQKNILFLVTRPTLLGADPKFFFDFGKKTTKKWLTNTFFSAKIYSNQWKGLQEKSKINVDLKMKILKKKNLTYLGYPIFFNWITRNWERETRYLFILALCVHSFIHWVTCYENNNDNDRSVLKWQKVMRILISNYMWYIFMCTWHKFC